MYPDDLRKIGKYGLIYYGTPSFAEAEFIMAELVTKYFQFYGMVVTIDILGGSLNAKSILNRTIRTIQTRLGLKVENYLTSMSDFTNTNKSALHKVKKHFKRAASSNILLYSQF